MFFSAYCAVLSSFAQGHHFLFLHAQDFIYLFKAEEL